MEGRVRGRRPWRRRCHLAAFLACAATLAFVPTGALGSDSQRDGGIFRISFGQLDYVDPALAYTSEAWALLDTACVRLMSRPDKPAPASFQLVPEVAADFPEVSRNGKTYTFTLRRGFHFSDGTPVLASSFARAINRVLAPDVRSPGALFMMDIAGAAEVRAGKAKSAAGITARGSRLVIRLTRPASDFPARTTMPFFCAVPPKLPSDPEGVSTFPAAGPYFIAEYRAASGSSSGGTASTAAAGHITSMASTSISARARARRSSIASRQETSTGGRSSRPSTSIRLGGWS